MARHRARALRVLIPVLLVAVVCSAAEEPQTPPASATTGRRVNIASPRCPVIDCYLTTWTVLKATKLWATHDATSEVVGRLAPGTKVEGIAARTVTKYLPLCAFDGDVQGRAAGCVEPDCKPVTFRAGEKFFLRERLNAVYTLIEARDGEFEIEDYLHERPGKIEFVHRYECDRKLDAEVWVQVRLPDGVTGWAYREHFDGTIDWSKGGVVGGVPTQ